MKAYILICTVDLAIIYTKNLSFLFSGIARLLRVAE